ncbi:MAG: lysylphosphatidylglycerol synthase transmembrane domain-containing protein [Limnochordia bacterium]|jgi:uncharacterized protein (TIRG00374 family)|nr:lysylphosphatidylglycerol synthase transmembrane domain-containing protein [Limnochordia bacterium]MDD4518191.1 lysylphosphatidylglycerol synthase transmembrane domain-containing protein [Limnochordia bacterium]
MSKEQGTSPDALRNLLLSKKVFLRLGFVFLLTFLAMILVLKRFTGEINIALLRQELGRWDTRFVVLALGSIFVYLIAKALRMAVMVAQFQPNMSFRDLLRISLVYIFVNTVTPFTAGGIPVQVYLLTRYGLSVAEASAVSFLEGVYTWCCFAAIAWPLVFLLPGELRQTVFPWSILALFVATLFAAFVVFITMKAGIAGRFFENLGGGLKNAKSSVARFLASGLEKFGQFVLQVDVALTSSDLLNTTNMITCFVITIMMWLSNFMVAPLLLRAAAVKTSVLASWGLQIIYASVAPLIPTPGGSGGTELLFASLFAPLLSGPELGAFVAIWRLLAYYVPLVIGCVATILQLRCLLVAKS